MRTTALLPPAALALLVGCAELDALVHNGVPCSQVSEETCEGADDPWHEVCVTCQEDYDWGKDYPWMEGTLAEGEDIRPIDAQALVHAPITTGDGAELDFWFLPAHGEDAALAGTTILYNHGNYKNIEHYLPRIRMLYEAGYNLAIWDYRGYGKTTPETHPSGPELMSDALDVLEATRELAPDPGRILVYGYSIGSLTAVEQGLSGEACALVLETPFPGIRSTSEAANGLALPGGLVTSGLLENDEKIADYEGPYFLMVAGQDTLFPPPVLEPLWDEAGSADRERWILEESFHGIRGGGIPEFAGLSTYLERLQGFQEELAPGCLGG